jgi:hypothetical protein
LSAGPVHPLTQQGPIGRTGLLVVIEADPHKCDD